ncbi:MAG: KEOPS complex subunit Pcc1 [Nitrososphaerota archaeon]
MCDSGREDLVVEAKAFLELVFSSSEEARIISGSINPDNFPLPHGLLISLKVEDNVVKILVESCRTLLSLLYTLDDIISMMILSLKTVKIVDEKRF